MQVTTELLEEIKAKAAPATGGKWLSRVHKIVARGYTPGSYIWIADRPVPIVRDDEDRWSANSDHIARMDPPTALALVEEIERLREALKPFADEAAKYDPEEGDDDDLPFGINIVVGDLRRARAALEGE